MQNDIDLVRRAKSGDMVAFDQLVYNYEKKVYLMAYRSTANEQDALDISQEVFIKVYRSIASFKEESSFSTWLYRITSNVLIDFSRKKQNKSTLSLYVENEDEEELYIDLPSREDTPEQAYEAKSLREEIQKALLSLSERHRQIVIMRDINGFSYTEISEILNISEGTVKSRLARARENLRRILELL